MHTELPIKLNADPIIDAVIEIRVKASQPLGSLMPGVLHQVKEVGFLQSQQLPAANIPEQIRRSDPNLMYQPLIKIDLEDGFSLLVGDQVLALVSPIPYVGGDKFKNKALQLIRVLLDLSVVESVQRVSIKYTDFLEAKSLQELDDYLNLDFKLGNTHTPEINGYDLNFHITKQNLLHLIRLVALTRLGNNQEGMILDIDTIKQINSTDIQDFKESLFRTLDEIHTKSKAKFFSLLTKKALDKLEAVYE